MWVVKFHDTVFISLPNNKLLDLSKWKIFADDEINATKKLKSAFGGI